MDSSCDDVTGGYTAAVLVASAAVVTDSHTATGSQFTLSLFAICALSLISQVSLYPSLYYLFI